MKSLQQADIVPALMPFVLCALLIPALSSADASEFYAETNLVSDTAGLATTTDVNLVNPWGLAHSPAGPWWISDNGAGKSSLYDGKGMQVAPAISIPSPTAGGTSAPTGVVFNEFAAANPAAFKVGSGTSSAPSIFIFATEDGTLAAWNKNLGGSAILVVDRSNAVSGEGDVGTVYKGLAIGSDGEGDFLYATNFRFGTIEMFDEHFNLVRSFTDPEITGICPESGQCFAPFGIQNIGGRLYVTFALQNAQKHDDQSGAGNGFVDIFSTDGILLRRLIARGHLNSPWGIALAPRDFGEFGGDLLIGNFGDGIINAYDRGGDFAGTLSAANGTPIQNDGLWSIAFGNAGIAGKQNELFFTAGIADESHGLFGKIAALPGERERRHDSRGSREARGD